MTATRQILLRLGAPDAVSWPVFWVSYLINVIIALVSGFDAQAVWWQRIIAATAGQVVMFAFLFAIRYALLARLVGVARAVATVVAFAVAGAFRGAAVSLAFIVLGPSSIEVLIPRIPGGVAFGLVVLIPVALAVVTVRSYRRTREDLLTRSAALEAARRQVVDEIEQRDAHAIDQVREAFQEAVETDDPSPLAAESLRAFATNVVRPLSHELASAVPTWRPDEGVGARVTVRDVLDRAAWGRPFLPWTTAVTAGALSVSWFVFEEGLPAALVYLVGGMLAVAAGLWFANTLLERLLPGRKLAMRVLLIVIGVTVGLFIGAGLWRILRLPGRRQPAALVGGLVAAAGYAALAGFAIPTQRALIMYCVAAIATLLARRPGPAQALLVAALVVLVTDPAAAHAPGFWLSFSAVALILTLSRGQRPGVTGLLRLQLGLTVGLAPLSMLFFGGWSPAGLFVNLVAIPLFSMLIVPLAFLAAALTLWLPMLGLPLLGALGSGLSRLLTAAEQVAGIGPGFLETAPLTLTTLVAGILGVGLLLLPGQAPGKWLGIPLLLPLILARPPLPAPGEAWITWLEVGQGNAAVIRTRNTTTVVDTGPAWPSGGNAAAFSLIPFLKERGVQRIDRLLITHGDLDHRGGIEAVDANFRIGQLLTGEPLHGRPGARRCRAGQHWRVDGVRFRLLAPRRSGLRGNAASCVLLVATTGGRVLFTGDIDARAERAVAAALTAPVDVMEAPHHGSAQSTTDALLTAARPTHAILSAGYRNPYGMPHTAVRLRLYCRGIRAHDLGQAGAVQDTHLFLHRNKSSSPLCLYPQIVERHL